MLATILIVCFFALPVAYFYILANRVVARKTRGLPLSFLIFVATASTAGWALSSDTRTEWWAPVAGFGVPGEAALAGFLVLGFTRWRDTPSRPARILAWAGLVASVLIIAFNVAQGILNSTK
jgi:hypothetical protein